MNAWKSLVFLIVCAASAAADRITLVDGRVYEGIVLREDEDELCIRLARGTATFPRDQVKEVVREKGALAEREERLEALAPERPAEYLKLAEWLDGDGRAARDPEIYVRLCEIAAALDRALACRANLVLGRHYEASGDAAASAVACGRARNADPADPEAATAAEQAKKRVEADARRATEDLRRGMELLGQDRLSEAAPLLLRGMTSPAAPAMRARLGMTIEDVLKSIRARIPCKSCDGSGTIPCARCKGTGAIRCSVCNGKGRLNAFKAGESDEAWVKVVCRSCLSIGDALCDNCHAERNAWLYFSRQAKDWDAGLVARGKEREHGIRIFCKAGEERAAFKARMDIPTWRIQGSIIHFVEADPISAGGTRKCPTCEGIAPDPEAPLPSAQDGDAARVWLDDILSDRTPFDFVRAVTGICDPEIAASREYYWRTGRWGATK